MAVYNIDDPVGWIEEAISKKHVRYYEYEHFSEIEEISSEAFGKIFRAKWKSSEQYLALKSFNTAKEIVNELIFQRDVDFHDNIIRFFGITLENNLSKNYSLVMEYADGGTLRKYLKKNFDNLTWKNKYDIAYQLACAVSCLHNEDIVHRNLHSKIILVHRNVVKLADFSLSIRIEESSQSTLLPSPYVDPQKFAEPTYKLNKRSDIYSIGILLWEISSGKIPSCDKSYETSNGLREIPVPDTPKAYVKLYIDCWDAEPDKRPNINDVVDRLKLEHIKNNPTYNINNSMHESSNIGSSSNIYNTDPFNQSEVYKAVDFISKNLNTKNMKNIINNINNYCKNNKIHLKEIHDFLLDHQDNINSIFLFGIFNLLGIENGINKKEEIKLFEKATKLGTQNINRNDIENFELFKKLVEEEYLSFRKSMKTTK